MNYEFSERLQKLPPYLFVRIEQMIADKSLGRKVGEVQSLIKSIKGVADVKVETSYFFVTSVPNDINKVQIEIIEEE